MKRTLVSLLILLTTSVTFAQENADIVGVSHVGGHYYFTTDNYLNEGAARIRQVGTKVIKLWVTGNPQKDYPFNSAWPPVATLVDTLKTPYFQEVFSRPFNTFVLMIDLQRTWPG
jgi:hypothetical protein